jgi:hypothetical protein
LINKTITKQSRFAEEILKKAEEYIQAFQKNEGFNSILSLNRADLQKGN